jgi:hypothetical protein
MKVDLVETPSFFTEPGPATTRSRMTLKKPSFWSRNEIEMSSALRGVEGSDQFELVCGCRHFKVSHVDDAIFEDCRAVEGIPEYWMLEYVFSRHEMVPWSQYFAAEIGKRLLVSRMIHGYREIISLLGSLKRLSVVHTNIRAPSLFFKSGGRPFLTGFDRSFFVPANAVGAADTIAELFAVYDPTMIHLPLEAHLLCYMTENKLESLSVANIETVRQDLVLSLSLSSVGKYITAGDIVAPPRAALVNRRKDEIQMQLVSTAWNVYSTSIMFLQLVLVLDAHAFPHRFVEAFVALLMHNIREKGSEDALAQFDALVYSITDQEWKQLLV